MSNVPEWLTKSFKNAKASGKLRSDEISNIGLMLKSSKSLALYTAAHVAGLASLREFEPELRILLKYDSSDDDLSPDIRALVLKILGEWWLMKDMFGYAVNVLQSSHQVEEVIRAISVISKLGKESSLNLDLAKTAFASAEVNLRDDEALYAHLMLCIAELRGDSLRRFDFRAAEKHTSSLSCSLRRWLEGEE